MGEQHIWGSAVTHGKILTSKIFKIQSREGMIEVPYRLCCWDCIIVGPVPYMVHCKAACRYYLFKYENILNEIDVICKSITFVSKKVVAIIYS